MLKYNQAEKILFDGMKQLVNEIPDIAEDDLTQLKYNRYNSTTSICNQTCIKINDSVLMTPNTPIASPIECLKRTKSARFIKYKKVKPRKSCPAYLTNTPKLYPGLEAFKTSSTSHVNSYVTVPSAPPKSDSDF